MRSDAALIFGATTNDPPAPVTTSPGGFGSPHPGQGSIAVATPSSHAALKAQGLSHAEVLDVMDREKATFELAEWNKGQECLLAQGQNVHVLNQNSENVGAVIPPWHNSAQDVHMDEASTQGWMP